MSLIEWMSLKGKGKGYFFSSCQKDLHLCKVTAGMSQLFLHPMMLCVQDTSFNWIKQLEVHVDRYYQSFYKQHTIY